MSKCFFHTGPLPIKGCPWCPGWPCVLGIVGFCGFLFFVFCFFFFRSWKHIMRSSPKWCPLLCLKLKSWSWSHVWSGGCVDRLANWSHTWKGGYHPWRLNCHSQSSMDFSPCPCCKKFPQEWFRPPARLQVGCFSFSGNLLLFILILIYQGVKEYGSSDARRILRSGPWERGILGHQSLRAANPTHVLEGEVGFPS